MAKTYKRTAKFWSLRNLPMRWFAIVVCSAIALFFLSYQEAVRGEDFNVKRALLNWTTPVMEVLSASMQEVNRKIDWVAEMSEAKTQQEQLQQEVQRLNLLNGELAYIIEENKALRKQLNLREADNRDFITARIISDTSGQFYHTLLLNAGSRQSVAENMPVVAGDALAGRIIEVGSNYSRVLLLTDWSSRIPAIVEGTGVQAIVAGQNTSVPLLVHPTDTIHNTPVGTSHTTPVGTGLEEAAGEAVPRIRVLTSGRGGFFPPGLVIGNLHIVPGDSADTSNRYQVFPHANTDKEIFLQIYTGIRHAQINDLTNTEQ